MDVLLTLEVPLWEILMRGAAVYLVIAIVLRVIPKQHTGGRSPNDLIALVIIRDVCADIRGFS